MHDVGQDIRTKKERLHARFGGQMDIEKAYFSLPEILERWSIPEDDLVYLAENDQLRLSIRVFDLPLEIGGYEEDSDGARFRVPEDQRYFSGLLDLHACDVFHLFRSGEVRLSEFRSGPSGYACLQDDYAPLYVVIGDLLLRRRERDLFEIKSGFTLATIVVRTGPSSLRVTTRTCAATAFSSNWGPYKRKSCARSMRLRNPVSPGRAESRSWQRPARRASRWRMFSSRRKTGGS